MYSIFFISINFKKTNFILKKHQQRVSILCIKQLPFLQYTFMNSNRYKKKENKKCPDIVCFNTSQHSIDKLFKQTRMQIFDSNENSNSFEKVNSDLIWQKLRSLKNIRPNEQLHLLIILYHELSLHNQPKIAINKLLFISINPYTLISSQKKINISLYHPTMDMYNMSPQQKALLSHICEILHIQNFPLRQFTQLLISHNWNILSAINSFLDSQQRMQIQEDPNTHQQHDNIHDPIFKERPQVYRIYDDYYENGYPKNRSFVGNQQDFWQLYLQKQEDLQQQRRITEKQQQQNELMQEKINLILQKKQKKQARLKIQPTVSLKILPYINKFAVLPLNNIKPIANISCQESTSPIITENLQNITTSSNHFRPLNPQISKIPIIPPNFPVLSSNISRLMIKFRLFKQVHIQMFDRYDKILTIFQYVDCNLRNSFQKVNADFDLVQSCNPLNLLERINSPIFLVFGMSQGEVLIVQQLQ